MSLMSFVWGALGLLSRDAAAAAPPSEPPATAAPTLDPMALYNALQSLREQGPQRETVTPVQLYTTRPLTAEDGKRLFAPAKPMRGVVPAEFAMDDLNNPMDNYGTGYSGLTEGMVWLGYPYLAELAQRTEYRRISETIAKDMTRRWFRLQATGDDDKTDKISALEDAIKYHKLREKFTLLAILDGFFGRSHLYLDTGATDDRDLLKLPLPLDARMIPKGGLKGIRVVEPMWCYPNIFNASDPLKTNFYLPLTWWVMGKEVHGTRLLPFIGREMPDMLKPAYSFGGLSLSQMAKSYVDNWLRTRQSVSDLIHSFSTPVMMTNMGEVLNMGASATLRMRADLFNFLRDNNNLMVIDKTTEDFKNVSAPLGALDHLQAQSQEHMASAVGIPLVVLLGISPSGLNATSEGELQVWAQFIHSQQTSFYDPNLTTILSVLQLDLFGEIDPAITHAWEPLREMSEQEEAAAEKTQADIDAVYVNAGVLSPDEIRQRLSGEADSPYQGLDLDTPAPTPPEQEPDPLAGPLGGGEAGAGGAAGGPGAPGGPVAPAPAGGSPKPVTSGPGKIGEAGGAAKPLDPRAGSRDSDNDNLIPPLGEGMTIIRPKEGDKVHVFPRKGDRINVKIANDGAIEVMAADAAHFVEIDHPRDEGGEFTAGSGGGGGGGPTGKPSAQPSQTDKRGMKPLTKGVTPPPHIAALKIPPGWSNVHYSDDPNASLLVTGRDALRSDKYPNGRPTSIYAAGAMAENAAAKLARIKELAGKYDAIAKQNDAAKRDPKRRDAADALELVMKMGIRPGSERDTGAAKQAYGATTLEGRHVRVSPNGNVRLCFTGKKGVSLNLPVDDPALAKMLAQRKQKAGATGKLFGGISDADLRSHTHSMNGGGFKTKDFRTHLGTQTAMAEIGARDAPASPTAYKKAVRDVATVVSAKLGNTPAVALQAYIAPEVFSEWRAAAGV